MSYVLSRALALFVLVTWFQPLWAADKSIDCSGPSLLLPAKSKRSAEIPPVEFAEWVQRNRMRLGLSLENLAREIHQAGYPISQNKLYRLEQNLKPADQQKRPLGDIDREFRLRLEQVFGEPFLISGDELDLEKELVPAASVVELVRQVKQQGELSATPAHPVLQVLRTEMLSVNHEVRPSLPFEALSTIRKWQKIFGSTQSMEFQMAIFEVFQKNESGDGFMDQDDLMKNLVNQTGHSENTIRQYLSDWLEKGLLEKRSSTEKRSLSYGMTDKSGLLLSQFYSK